MRLARPNGIPKAREAVRRRSFTLSPSPASFRKSRAVAITLSAVTSLMTAPRTIFPGLGTKFCILDFSVLDKGRARSATLRTVLKDPAWQRGFSSEERRHEGFGYH